MNTNPENTGVSKYARSFGLSLALASVVNGLLVVAKEKSPAIQSAMQKLTGHHWVTHGVIILGLYAGCGLIFAKSNGGQGVKLTANGLIAAVAAGVGIGGLIILGFYLIGD